MRVQAVAFVALVAVTLISEASVARGACETATTSYVNPTGTLAYPLSGNYANYLDICFTILTGGDRVRLDFTRMDVESGYDYLYIYDGPDENAPLVATYTGTTLPADFVACADAVTIRLKTDYSYTYTGFALDWDAIVYDQCCGLDLRPVASTGTISNPSPLSGAYLPDADCGFRASVPAIIGMQFSYLSLAAGDEVRVYNGDSNGANLYATYTGTTLPTKELIGDGGSFFVEFESDDLSEGGGFSVDYYTLTGGGGCTPSTTIETNGTTTVKVPDGGAVYAPGVTCDWIITTAPGKVLSADVTFLDLGSGDWMELRDGGSVAAPLMATAVDSDAPAVLVTSSNELFVRFYADNGDSRRGVVLDVTVADQGAQCNASTAVVVSGANGATIQTPTPYPGGLYDAGRNCVWNIAPSGTGRAELFVDVYSLAAGDTIEVRDGSDGSAPLLGTVTGSTAAGSDPLAFLSTFGPLYVEFNTLVTSSLATGFSARTTLLDGPLPADGNLLFDANAAGEQALVCSQTNGFDFRSAYTVEMWIKPTDLDGDVSSRLLHFVDASDKVVVTLGRNQFSSFSNSRRSIIVTHVDGTGSETPYSGPRNSILENEWQHIALVWSGSSWTIYINGISVSKFPMSGVYTLDPPSPQFSLGHAPFASCGTTCHDYHGFMDEVRIWNVARSQSQIVANMNGVIFDTADPTLQAYWRFGETGPTPLELTGNIAGCTLGCCGSYDPPARVSPSLAPIFAGPPHQITIDDAPTGVQSGKSIIAGIRVTVRDQRGFPSPQAGVEVELVIAGTVVATVVTDAAGQASTTSAVSNAEGSTTLVARGAVLALVEDSQPFFISPPDPDVLAISPNSFTLDHAGFVAVTVSAFNSSGGVGNMTGGVECRLILASTGEVFASGPFDNVTGAATFALSNYHVAGLHSIVATSIPSRFSSAGAAMTVPVDVLAAIVPNAPPNQIVAGEEVTLSVGLEDQWGNMLTAPVQCWWSADASAGFGSYAQPSYSADIVFVAAGAASVTWSCNDTAVVSVTETYTVVPAAPSVVAVSPAEQVIAVDATGAVMDPVAFTYRIADAFGNTVVSVEDIDAIVSSVDSAPFEPVAIGGGVISLRVSRLVPAVFNFTVSDNGTLGVADGEFGVVVAEKGEEIVVLGACDVGNCSACIDTPGCIWCHTSESCDTVAFYAEVGNFCEDQATEDGLLGCATPEAVRTGVIVSVAVLGTGGAATTAFCCAWFRCKKSKRKAVSTQKAVEDSEGNPVVVVESEMGDGGESAVGAGDVQMAEIGSAPTTVFGAPTLAGTSNRDSAVIESVNPAFGTATGH